MKRFEYEEFMYSRDIDRTPLRYAENKCQYCGYRQRPSSSLDACTNCASNFSSKSNKNI